MENHKTKMVKENKTDLENASPQGKEQCCDPMGATLHPSGNSGHVLCTTPNPTLQDNDLVREQTGMEGTSRICPTELSTGAPWEGDTESRRVCRTNYFQERESRATSEKTMIPNGGLKNMTT